MKQSKLWLILLVFVVVGVGLWLAMGHSNSYKISQALPAPESFSSVAPYGENTMVVPDNNSFITYDYVTGQTTSISPSDPYGGLGGIDSLSVSADRQYLLFNDGQAVPEGILYNQLVAEGQDPTLDYWWVFSVAKQKFIPLPQGILLAKFNGNGDSVVTLGSANGGEALTTFAAGSSAPRNTISVTGSSDFFPVQGGYLLETPENDVLFTQNGTVSKTLYTSMLLVGTTADGKTAIGVSTSGTEHQLELLNVNKDSQASIASNIVNQPVWLNSQASNGGTVFYSESVATNGNNTTSLGTYDIATHKNVSFQFVKPATNTTQLGFSPITLLSATTAVVSSDSTNYYLIGNGLTALKIP
jgi:hypothetical protein